MAKWADTRRLFNLDPSVSRWLDKSHSPRIIIFQNKHEVRGKGDPNERRQNVSAVFPHGRIRKKVLSLLYQGDIFRPPDPIRHLSYQELQQV